MNLVFTLFDAFVLSTILIFEYISLSYTPRSNTSFLVYMAYMTMVAILH